MNELNSADRQKQRIIVRDMKLFLGKGTKNVSIDLNHEELAKWEKWKPDTIIRKNLLGVQNTHMFCVCVAKV